MKVRCMRKRAHAAKQNDGQQGRRADSSNVWGMRRCKDGERTKELMESDFLFHSGLLPENQRHMSILG